MSEPGNLQQNKLQSLDKSSRRGDKSKSSQQQELKWAKDQQNDEIIQESDNESQKQVDTLKGIFHRLRLKVIGRNLVQNTTSRKMRNLGPQQYFLINDQSIPLSQEVQNKCKRGKFIKKQNELSIFAIEETIPNKKCHFSKTLKRLLSTKFFILLKTYFNKIPKFDPSGNFKYCWDFLHMILILLFLFWIPIHIAFDRPLIEFVPNFIYYFTPYSLIVDMIINFNTGYYDKGIPIYSGYKIFLNYIKNNAVTDILSIFPFLIFNFQNNDRQEYHQYSVASSFQKFTLMLFYLKIKAFGDIFKKIEERSNLSKKKSYVLQLIKLLFTILVIAHLLACFWILFDDFQKKNGAILTWLTKLDIESQKWSSIYLRAFYFIIVTMATVGYGDILPVTDIEIVLCIFQILISCGVYAYTLNKIGNIFQDFDYLEQDIKKSMMIMNGYMNSKNVNKNLQYQIREYIDYFIREKQERDEDSEEKLISILSQDLRDKLLIESNKIVLKDAPIFKKNFSQEIIKRTVPIIKQIRVTPYNFIIQQDKLDDCSIYFIESGSVEIIKTKKIPGQKIERIFVQKVLKKGEYFGSESFFTGLSRDMTIRTNEFTTMLTIKREDFVNVLKSSQKDYEQFCGMKDLIMFQKNYECLEVQCMSCGQYKHREQDCPLINMRQEKLRIIKKYNKSCEVKERVVYGRRELKLNSLDIMEDMNFCAEDFQEDYEEECLQIADSVTDFPILYQKFQVDNLMIQVQSQKEINLLEDKQKKNLSVLGEKKGTFNKINLLKKLRVLKAKQSQQENEPQMNRYKKKLIYISKKEKQTRIIEEQALNFIDQIGFSLKETQKVKEGQNKDRRKSSKLQDTKIINQLAANQKNAQEEILKQILAGQNGILDEIKGRQQNDLIETNFSNKDNKDQQYEKLMETHKNFEQYLPYNNLNYQEYLMDILDLQRKNFQAKRIFLDNLQFTLGYKRFNLNGLREKENLNNQKIRKKTAKISKSGVQRKFINQENTNKYKRKSEMPESAKANKIETQNKTLTIPLKPNSLKQANNSSDAELNVSNFSQNNSKKYLFDENFSNHQKQEQQPIVFVSSHQEQQSQSLNQSHNDQKSQEMEMIELEFAEDPIFIELSKRIPDHILSDHIQKNRQSLQARKSQDYLEEE